jgi:hypothetical protein
MDPRGTPIKAAQAAPPASRSLTAEQRRKQAIRRRAHHLGRLGGRPSRFLQMLAAEGAEGRR